MPPTQCSSHSHSRASEKTCPFPLPLPAALRSLHLSLVPTAPLNAVKVLCCPIPSRQTLGNFAICILLTSLASHPVKITSVPNPKDGGRPLQAGTELLRQGRGSRGAREQGRSAASQRERGPGPRGLSNKGQSNLQDSILALGFIPQKT